MKTRAGIQRANGSSPLGKSKAAGAASAVSGSDASLEMDVIWPALAALRHLPDFDEVRVDALRTAMKEGRIPFDACKLAGLIKRFHGVKG
ncbi:flagellar biosynthesis anti-sigma factor FlgM [Burkholderia diffusa]|nr:flagellar biosynthesis anti-sigma factor FlgM [Burkholderia diffusa]